MAKAKKRSKPKNKKRNNSRPERQTTALAVIDKQAIQRTEGMDIMQPAASVVQTMANREKVRRFMARCLNVELQEALRRIPAGKQLDQKERERLEIDWGTIPGVDKPFLKQPGAEKFAFWLSVRPKYIKVEHDLGGGHLEVVAHCILLTKKTGEEVFEGPDCSCSTMESNYRFRWAEVEFDKDNPRPSDEILEERKKRGEGRWRKKSEYARGQKVGEKWVWQERVENTNIHDERNKVRQIGQKRALVKAVRNMGALSEIFTSDPSEWDIPYDDDDPKNETDFTEAGRRIVQSDGTMPSGRPAPAYHQPRDAKGNTQAQQEAAAATIAEKKKAMEEPVRGEPVNENAGPAKKIVTVTWSQDGKVAKVTGEIASIEQWMKGTLGATWSEQHKALLVTGDRVPDIRWGAEKQGLVVQEVKPAKPPVMANKGVVKKIKPNETTSRGAVNVQLLLNGVWCYCYHKHLFEALRGSLDQEVELVFEKASGPPKITGIKCIGDKKFEENVT